MESGIEVTTPASSARRAEELRKQRESPVEKQDAVTKSAEEDGKAEEEARLMREEAAAKKHAEDAQSLSSTDSTQSMAPETMSMGAAGSHRGVPRSVFLERVKSLQAFEAQGSPPAAGAPRSGNHSVPRSGNYSSSVRPAPTIFECSAPDHRDRYKLGRYDLVTANLHGSYEVVKGGSTVYQGIDAELAA